MNPNPRLARAASASASVAVASVILSVLVAAVLSGTACGGRSDRSGEETAAPKRYALHGVVREVKNEGKDVLVDHDPIPGFMGGMTMLFPVQAPPQVMRSLTPGDMIDAALVVEESRYWLEEIRRKPGPIPPGAPPATPPTAAAPGSPGAITPIPNRSVAIGGAITDFELTDQTGRPVRLSQMRGEPVAVTFLYTRCPIATACPLTTAKFSRLDALLKEKGFGRILIVTVEPEHDTPAVLADYARRVGADAKRWKFLTGSPKAVADVASEFGVLYYPERGQVIHGQGVAVVDPQGRLSSIYYGETWEPEHLLRDMEKARKG